MNPLDHYLIKTAGLEKTAFDQTIRNLGSDIVYGAGRTLRSFEKNPMLASAVLGAGAGGVHGAMSAEPGERRGKKALRSAIAGGIAGGVTGGVLSGAARNIGRYGRDIEEAAAQVRGASPGLRDAKPREFASIMRDAVFNPDSMRGGKKLKATRDQLRAADEVVAASGAKADADDVKRLRKLLNQEGGGLGARFNPLEAAAMISGAGVAGSMANNAREKNAALRIRSVIDKQASFAQLAAKAMGGVATGAGKAVQVGAANPALAGAALGAGTGALAAGEGNRLKGMIGGAALGAAGGAAAGKFAPNAMKNVQKAGQNLSRAGKDTSVLAGAAQKGDKFKDMMSPQFKNVLNPFKPTT